MQQKKTTGSIVFLLRVSTLQWSQLCTEFFFSLYRVFTFEWTVGERSFRFRRRSVFSSSGHGPAISPAEKLGNELGKKKTVCCVFVFKKKKKKKKEKEMNGNDEATNGAGGAKRPTK